MVEEENDKQVFIILPNNTSVENSQLRRAWIIAILALTIGLVSV